MKRKLREYPYCTVIAILAIIGGYSFLLLMDYNWSENHFTVCPFKLVTGIPCPGCGMGRATLSLFGGNVVQSLYYNILCIPFTVAVLIGLYRLVFDLLEGRDSFFKIIRQPLKKRYTILLLVVIIIAWALNIYHGMWYSYKLQVTSYKLQVTSYKLRVTSYELTGWQIVVGRSFY